jgi:hypothetical protein
MHWDGSVVLDDPNVTLYCSAEVYWFQDNRMDPLIWVHLNRTEISTDT